MTAAKKNTPPESAAPAEVWETCGSCFRERCLTAEGVLVEHNAWYGMRIGMQPCPGSKQPSAEAVAA